MCGPFNRNTWDSRCPLSHSATVSMGFPSQNLWGLLFLVLEPWAGEPGVRLGFLTVQRGPPQPRYPSRFLMITHQCGTSLFLISASTSLDMASSVCPYLEDFCSDRLQAILNNGCSVVRLSFWGGCHAEYYLAHEKSSVGMVVVVVLLLLFHHHLHYQAHLYSWVLGHWEAKFCLLNCFCMSMTFDDYVFF